MATRISKYLKAIGKLGHDGRILGMVMNVMDLCGQV